VKIENLKGINIVWLSKTGLTNLNSGEGESNLVDIKRYKMEGKEYPYVSGQAMRHYFKEAIRRSLKKGEKMCRPDNLGETCADISGCIGCDLFGFMKTVKGKGAMTRVSPVKVSPATGMLQFDENSVLDFLTRRKPQETVEERTGDIVNVEIGMNIYKCGVTVDVMRVGCEELWTKDSYKMKALTSSKEKMNRISKMIESLRFITDYSKQARLLTDFTPDVICLSFQSKYSHRLQKLFELKENYTLNETRIKQILDDVKDYTLEIKFGLISDVIDNENSIRNLFKSYKIPVSTPAEVVNSSIKELAKHTT